MLILDLNTEFKRVEEQEEDLLSNNSVNFRTQSLDHLDYGVLSYYEKSFIHIVQK